MASLRLRCYGVCQIILNRHTINRLTGKVRDSPLNGARTAETVDCRMTCVREVCASAQERSRGAVKVTLV